MTVELTIAFSSLLVEHEHLLTLYQRRNYFANHLSTLNRRSTYRNVAFVVNQKNFFKLNCCTSLSILHVVYKQLFASFCLKLLAVNFYNCVHLTVYLYKLAPAGGC